MSAEFVHLHVHSEYSLLDGLPHPDQLAARASQLGQPAVAITDHGALFAAIEFHDGCRQAGVKPIIGMEAYLAPRGRQDHDPKLDRNAYHLLLLAENETGYRNLVRLATAAQLEGFYYYPRIDKEILARNADGLIATTGCLSAEIPQLLAQDRTAVARQAVDWYRQVFPGRFYLELQEHGLPELQKVNAELLRFAHEFELKTIATNDVHYLNAEDWFAQDILICIQTGSTVTATDRMRMAGRDYYFKSTEEMAELWRDYPEALRNTLEIAERSTVDLESHGYHLPYFPIPAGFESAAPYLRSLCEQGLGQRYGQPLPEPVRERFEYELGVIHRMGFETYFLIVGDLTQFAREQNIWYNVRGSAAGSIVAYGLGITNLDPLEHGLVFERFLNPGRISMPDIDLDFPDDRRDEMIAYAVDKYGRENVAQIITFGKLLAKAAIRDVGRALDYPLTEVDRVAKLIPVGPGQTIEGALERIPEFRQLYESNDYTRKLVDTAKLLEGVARHASTHAAGVVIADKPIVEYTPLHRPTRGDQSGFAVTQFPMGDIEHIGLLKIDFLGLATLTIMRRACELIEQRHGIHYDLSNIPVEDPAAFELLSRGDVTGLFQVEGAGMRRVLTGMKPSRFDHIVATISLFRPGPMEYIPTYIRRMHGEEPVEYKHPLLESILAETYGIIVYQEQIIRIAVQLAGYTPGAADDIRKAVGKKIREKIEAHRVKFINGAVANGVEARVAASIYDDIEFFARYGFNKAHAADYAVLTCQTAFLKAHYLLEYMCALMQVEVGDLDKIAVLVGEARRLGIPVLGPDVRYSDVNFVIDEARQAIRFGLSAIKNVGEGAAEVLVKARAEGGAFASLDDFVRRVDLRQLNRRVLESLIKAGALTAFGHREQLLKVVDRMLSASASFHHASALGQMSFFGAGMQADSFAGLPAAPEMPQRQKLELEKDLMGVYFSEHPLLQVAQLGKQIVSAYVGELNEEAEGHVVTLGGAVSAVRQIMTKKGDPMAFFNLEDPQGTIEVTAFPRAFAQARELLRDDELVLVKGKVQVRENKVTILADKIDKFPLTLEAGAAANLSRPEATRPEVPVLDDWVPPPEEFSGDEAPPDVVSSSEVTAEPAAAPPPPEEPPAADTTAAPPPSLAAPAPLPELKLGSAVQIPSKTNGGNGGPSAPASPGPARQDPAAASVSREAVPRYAAPPSGGRLLRVRIQRSRDAEIDVRRMRGLIQLLRSAEGPDRFSLIVANPGGNVLLDFPNFHTNYQAVAHELNELIADWGEVDLQ